MTIADLPLGLPSGMISQDTNKKRSTNLEAQELTPKIIGLCQAGKWEEAKTQCDEALESGQVSADLLYLRSYIAGTTRDLVGAMHYLERSLEHDGNQPNRLTDLGNLYTHAKRFDEARRCCEQALNLEPDNTRAKIYLAVCCSSIGQFDEALELFLAVKTLQPENAMVLRSLCFIYNQLFDLDEAVSCGLKAVELAPDDAVAHYNLGGSYNILGDMGSARSHFQRALVLDPGMADVRSSYLMSLHYDTEITVKELWRAHVEQSEHFNQQSRMRIPLHEKAQRIKVGYVSGDFRSHPVAQFLTPILKHHDHSAVETFAYSSTPNPDHLTEQLAAMFDHWLDVKNITDEALAERIAADQIDVLVDLSGHTGHNRLAVFARKPAPVQISYLGYPCSTGLDAIDYFLGDDIVFPAGVNQELAILRLPDSFCCFEPVAGAPLVSALPALQNDVLTFASLNNPNKISVDQIRIWAAILDKVDNAVLCLQGVAFNSHWARQRIEAEFKKCGVDSDRLTILPSEPLLDHLKRYQKVDIALDTYPWSGHTTLCNALWMGVPVVHRSGDTPASRFGRSVLLNLELDELVVDTEEAYIDKAVALANNLPRLAELRSGMRQRMVDSPVVQAEPFTRNLEALLISLVG